MEVVKASQCFEPVEGGRIKFIYSQVLFLRDGSTFCAKSSSRAIGPRVCPDTLQDIRRVSTEALCPLLPSGCTIAPGPSDAYYVKKPDLMSFGGPIDPSSLVLQELAVCEVLRKHPHPNIAAYAGCLVSDGRVAGLCFTRYPETLLHKINPGSLNKSALVRSSDRMAARKLAARYLPGIEAGILHLHGLGLVHNDLNPANIMITEDDTPVIIDFDGASAPGTALDDTKRTYEWYDRDVRVSQESNDLAALEEIRVWLTGSSPDKFQFEA
ncbi:hypothetical protein B0T19DRAFT_430091 [Cercophora scortea]|uniref:Protein kinase domain-containing protein n=1 Tax=Cercophora scortea TaxID=314031 RepID=A0AAE0I8V1_9PEZI|nr:hypothetical protein B0T19DRAFT_430091 [Cercophora scortea]